MCTNNTIEGSQFHTMPETGEVPLVADMSSDIASRATDVKKFGVIFAGAQKNLGPSGAPPSSSSARILPSAPIRISPRSCNTARTLGKSPLYHTPPAFAIYIIGLVMEWIDSLGGITAIQKRNETKAKLLYDTIDTSNGYFKCPVEKASRSRMNVVFRIAGGDEAAEKEFAMQAEAAGLVGTPGPRSVGGMRISLYNAVELAAVEALTSFMKDFQRKRG